MRRTVGVIVGAAAVVTLAGVAGAHGEAAQAPPGSVRTLGGLLPAVVPAAGVTPPEAGQAPPEAGRAPVTLPGDGVAARRDTPSVDRPVPPGPAGAGPHRIGTVLRIGRLLRAEGQRSTVLRYPGSGYVKVFLTGAALSPGGTVTVADPLGREVHRYDARSLGGPAGRWAMSVTGDTAVVTVTGGTVTVDRVARGLTAVERAAQPAAPVRPARGAGVGEGAGAGSAEDRTGRQESICGGDDKADAVCYRSREPELYRRSKAVVRLLINGSELCTGWRIGPLNRLITNKHCISDSRAAFNTEVWFNYQCASCGGFAVFPPTKVWGGRVLATDDVLDLALFSVEDFDRVERFGHLEFETRRPVAGDEVAIPQHPAGEPTMIALRSDEDRGGTCLVADPAYDGFAPDSDVSYFCDTEGGSSGSPVLSRSTGRVIALHHFGGCPNSGTRADLIQRRLAGLV